MPVPFLFDVVEALTEYYEARYGTKGKAQKSSKGVNIGEIADNPIVAASMGIKVRKVSKDQLR